jgi:hypothetical protein
MSEGLASHNKDEKNNNSLTTPNTPVPTISSSSSEDNSNPRGDMLVQTMDSKPCGCGSGEGGMEGPSSSNPGNNMMNPTTYSFVYALVRGFNIVRDRAEEFVEEESKRETSPATTTTNSSKND